MLSEKLEQAQEAFVEADEMRQRLSTKKNELELLLEDLEAKVEEEEDKSIKLSDEKRLLQQNITDLEEQ